MHKHVTTILVTLVTAAVAAVGVGELTFRAATTSLRQEAARIRQDADSQLARLASPEPVGIETYTAMRTRQRANDSALARIASDRSRAASRSRGHAAVAALLGGVIGAVISATWKRRHRRSQSAPA